MAAVAGVALSLSVVCAAGCGGSGDGTATMSFALDLSPTPCSLANFVRSFVIDVQGQCLLGGPIEVAEGKQIAFDNLAIESGTALRIKLIALRSISSTVEQCLCASQHAVTAKDGLEQTLQLRPLTSTAPCQPPTEPDC